MFEVFEIKGIFESTDRRVDVCIDLEPGMIWEFCIDVQGKTRLCKLFKKLEPLGVPVCGYSYEDFVASPDSLKEKLLSGKYKAVLLDRYDLYPKEAHEEICRCAENAIVMIDCKRGFTGRGDVDACSIDMSADRIVVWGLQSATIPPEPISDKSEDFLVAAVLK